uniref:NADH-ubiquinone oxidoreductase chain 6 n=1 Tax=Callulina kreffti TaxID=248777 RepID=S4V128_9NEOB|nr:NADH dehydrogenase subunit 6 [Callulina kreffti]
MMFELGLLGGLLAVASNPSPYFAALGLVWGAGAGCLLLINSGVTFLSLVLVLVYLGGMMVVFAYCAALVAEPYPEAWGSLVVFFYLLAYSVVLVVCLEWLGKGLDISRMEDGGLGEVMKNYLGVSELFGEGGWVLFFGGWSLLLTLFSALEVVRGHYSGVLRVV